MQETQIRLLHRLAGLYGIQTVYRDAAGKRREAAPHQLLAALRALGAPVENTGDVPGALRERRQKLWRRCCEPVAVAWEGRPAHVELRVPANQAETPVDCRLELEDGETRQWTRRPDRLPAVRAAAVEGVDYVAKQLDLPAGLPPGYHRCTFTVQGAVYHTLLIIAPQQAYLPPAEATGRKWGVFLPLYALRSGRSWAAGDIADLELLLRWVQGLGGDMVGTLPLLAAFLDEPFDPSPYAPASRLFWNEFYLAVDHVPELRHCPEARGLLNSPAFQAEIAALRGAPVVDYRRGMAVKRRILEMLARCCYEAVPGRRAELERWAAENPAVLDYARFRAVVEQRRAGWQKWPDRMQNGELRKGDYDPGAARYHLYVQWLAAEQFQTLAALAREHGSGLYLDLPLGVHIAGYDVWRERAAFATNASTGAPPDPLNTAGQDWEFAPMHPERIRERHYRYFISCLRHHLRHAGVLRLDHVMGLHRLYWIPKGLTAREGVYVRYHAEEFYAILTLESHRHKTLLVGEDLGTVPGEVRTAMARHKIYRMYILPFEMKRVPRRGFNPVPARSLAALNTHDMPPFKAQWQNEDNARRSGILSTLHKKGRLKAPAGDTGTVLRACLKHLAAGRARIIMINLEDLWLEEKPQNMPGTKNEHNWRRKAAVDFEVFSRMPGVLRTLRSVDKLRHI